MRALSGNTRKATAVTLAAALVIAVYLNWQYARNILHLRRDSSSAFQLRRYIAAGILPV